MNGQLYYKTLRDAGYDVAGVGKFDLHKSDKDWGLDGKNMLPEYGFTSGCDNEGKGDAITSYRNNGHKAKVRTMIICRSVAS